MAIVEDILKLIPSKRTRSVAMAAGGMVGLLTGQKLVALGLFAKGAKGLEECWREAHPNFTGGMDARWREAIEFYEATHLNSTNRKLHTWGIPPIVAGATGLLLFRPFRPAWFVSATAFTGGWIVNFIGHGFYEKNAPAFADDPLSFLAGPVWDLQQMRKNKVVPPQPGNTQSDADAVVVNAQVV